MPGFTTEEVQTSVDRYLYKQVVVPRLTTGVRDITTIRDRVYDLVTTALVLRPDAYFYVVWLAINKLRGLLSAQLNSVSSIVSSGPNSTRPSKRIKSTTELVNAKSAITAISAGLNTRSTGVRGTISPAVERFRRSVERFIGAELVKNVVVGGSVVETGEELRGSIASEWADGKDRHYDIVDLVERINSALLTLEKVKLPETSIRDIVSKISSRLDEVKSTLEGDEAAAQSRESMLDLLTMRTLLTKASSFRNPERDLAPGTGDAPTAFIVDSTGEQASIQGTVSAPFNYAPGATFTFSVNSGAETPSMTLPETLKGSRAELRSFPLVGIWPHTWATPATAAIYVDFSTTKSCVIPGGGLITWADGPAAATALNTALSPEVVVTWDVAENQLVFQSASPGDASFLRFFRDTVARQKFVEWAFYNATDKDFKTLDNKGVPIPIKDITDLIGETTSSVDATAEETQHDSFKAVRTSTPGEEATLWNRIVTGTDLQPTSTGARSATKNFEKLGIKPGMAVHTTAPAIADYAITAVSGGDLTLDSPLSAGPATFYAGPDYRTVPAGARVQVTGRQNLDNTGFYRVASAGVAKIVVDRNLPGADDPMVTVSEAYLKIEARGTTTNSGVGVLAASGGATAFGLSVTAAESGPQLSKIQLSGSGDFLVRGVRVGDTLNLVSPTLVQYTVRVTTVSVDTLEFTPSVPTESGNWNYTVQSAKVLAFESQQGDLDTFLSSTYVADFKALDRYMTRLITGAKYDGEIETAIGSYQTALTTLRSALGSYSVPRERTVDAAIRMMEEQGFDRALDLFTGLQLDELFTMSVEGVSYQTNLIRNAADTTRQVVPVSKNPRGINGIPSLRRVSFQPDPYEPDPGVYSDT